MPPIGGQNTTVGEQWKCANSGAIENKNDWIARIVDKGHEVEIFDARPKPGGLKLRLTRRSGGGASAMGGVRGVCGAGT